MLVNTGLQVFSKKYFSVEDALQRKGFQILN